MAPMKIYNYPYYLDIHFIPRSPVHYSTPDFTAIVQQGPRTVPGGPLTKVGHHPGDGLLDQDRYQGLTA